MGENFFSAMFVYIIVHIIHIYPLTVMHKYEYGVVKVIYSHFIGVILCGTS